MTRAVIEGGLVFDGDAAAGAADILIEDGRIAAVAAPGSFAEAAAERLDARRRLIIPGLINAHTHGHGALAKGLGDRLSLELFLNAGPAFHGGRTDDDRKLSAMLNAAEMIRKGCTACFDLALVPATPEAILATAEGYAAAGMRAVVAPMIADRSLYDAIPGLRAALPAKLGTAADALRPGPAGPVFAAIDAAARHWPFSRGTLALGIGPTIPLHCSDDFLREADRLSRAFGLPLQTHLAESPVQREASRRRHGMTMTAHLASLGLLRPGVSAAHGVWLDDAELDLLAARDVAIAHNPAANLRLGSGVADIRAALMRGIAVGIGTDGASSSDNQNMFLAMRSAAHVSRITGREPAEWIGAAEAVAMATEGSARVLGLEARLGRIAAGFEADLAWLDLDHVNLVPLNDVANQLVHSEDGAAVRDVMVGGRFVMRNGRLLQMDWPAVARAANDRAEALRAVNRGAHSLAGRLAAFVGPICADLACRPELPRRLTTRAPIRPS